MNIFNIIYTYLLIVAYTEILNGKGDIYFFEVSQCTPYCIGSITSDLEPYDLHKYSPKLETSTFKHFYHVNLW